MREELTDVIRQTVGLFEDISVIGTEQSTVFEAVRGLNLFYKATTNTPLLDAIGEWGVGDLPMLNGLLNFAPYCGENSQFIVNKRKYNNIDVVDSFELREANKSGAIFRTIRKSGGEKIGIADASWDIVFEPQKAKIAAFQQLAGIYNKIDQFFGVETKDGNLVFSMGNENSSTHYVDMIFESNVEGTIDNPLRFSIADFSTIVKLAGSNTLTMNLTSRSVIAMNIKTQYATHNYYMRASRD